MNFSSYSLGFQAFPIQWPSIQRNFHHGARSHVTAAKFEHCSGEIPRSMEDRPIRPIRPEQSLGINPSDIAVTVVNWIDEFLNIQRVFKVRLWMVNDCWPRVFWRLLKNRRPAILDTSKNHPCRCQQPRCASLNTGPSKTSGSSAAEWRIPPVKQKAAKRQRCDTYLHYPSWLSYTHFDIELI